MNELVEQQEKTQEIQLRQKILEKIASLRDKAIESSGYAGIATIEEGLGAAFFGYGMFTQSNNQPGAEWFYVIGAAGVLSGEIGRRITDRDQRRFDGIANHLEAQLTLDTLKDEK